MWFASSNVTQLLSWRGTKNQNSSECTVIEPLLALALTPHPKWADIHVAAVLLHVRMNYEPCCSASSSQQFLLSSCAATLGER